MRVLFVKLTSMGDLIHALPALTDVARIIPEISFDWVIEKNFSEVAKWHPAVKNIIPTSHRRWKKNLLECYQKGEIQQFIKSLRKEKYDLVIDGQASIKSAIIMLLSRGLRCGLDINSAREWLAHLAYQKKFFVDKDMHAVNRLRLLFANIFDYPIKGKPDYGIANYKFPALNFVLPKPYLVFVHNASWQSKLWPEPYWRQLCAFAMRDGFNVLLPWGNEAEKRRAIRIKMNNPNTQVLPFCSLSQHAAILKQSNGAICSDTGLSHLAAALNVPAVTLYGSTSSKLIGTAGLNQKHFITPFACKTCYKQECHYDKKIHSDSQCQLAMKPDMVWQAFKRLIE
jgi:heptosyltransferase-1